MIDITNSPTTSYIIDIENRERLEFQYNPSEIVDDKSVRYTDIAIPGISHPRHQYIAGGNRRVSFRLHFFKGEVKEKVAWLQSLLYPEHSGTALKSPPHRVIFIFGNLYDTTCIVRQIKARYFSLFDTESLSPQRAEVDVVLEEIIEESVNYQTVKP